MEELNVCPSILAEGFHTYSPAALKLLFDGSQVSHILLFDSPNNEGADNEEYSQNTDDGRNPEAPLPGSDVGGGCHDRRIGYFLPQVLGDLRHHCRICREIRSEMADYPAAEYCSKTGTY